MDDVDRILSSPQYVVLRELQDRVEEGLNDLSSSTVAIQVLTAAITAGVMELLEIQERSIVNVFEMEIGNLKREQHTQTAGASES